MNRYYVYSCVVFGLLVIDTKEKSMAAYPINLYGQVRAEWLL